MKWRVLLLVLMITANCISCKKSIPRKKPELEGFWVNIYDCQDQIRISSDGNGSYRVRGVSYECHDGSYTEGEAKIRGKKIWINKTKFEIVSDPVSIDTLDVAVDSTSPYTGKSVTSMVLKKSIFNTGKTYTFYKIIGH